MDIAIFMVGLFLSKLLDGWFWSRPEIFFLFFMITRSYFVKISHFFQFLSDLCLMAPYFFIVAYFISLFDGFLLWALPNWNQKLHIPSLYSLFVYSHISIFSGLTYCVKFLKFFIFSIISCYFLVIWDSPLYFAMSFLIVRLTRFTTLILVKRFLNSLRSIDSTCFTQCHFTIWFVPHNGRWSFLLRILFPQAHKVFCNILFRI